MKMYFYRGRRPNFGDELNPWLWPRLLPGFFDDDDSSLFLGIGSTLYDFLPAASAKIVCGAGYGGYTPVPRIDARWTFYFVRGRLTAETLGIDRRTAVGDAAILVRSCPVPVPETRHRVSFMPHWESAIDGEWEEVARLAGVHYIDPCGTVDRVLADIAGSQLLVTEAMHGAIAADALRVPWIAARPIQPAHRWKWLDWTSALDVALDFGRLAPSNALELALRLGGRKHARALRARPGLRRVAARRFKERAAGSLARLAARHPSLSTDAAIDRAHSRMLDRLEQLRKDFPRRQELTAAR